MTRKCCVPNCTNRGGPMHTFPLYEEDVFKEWRRRIANPKFEEIQDDREIHKRFLICTKHFSSFNRDLTTKRLRIYSVPTIDVPGFSGEVTEENSFCYRLPPNTKQVTPKKLTTEEQHETIEAHGSDAIIEHNYCQRVKECDEINENTSPVDTPEEGEVVEEGEIVDDDIIEEGEIVKGIMALNLNDSII